MPFRRYLIVVLVLLTAACATPPTGELTATHDMDQPGHHGGAHGHDAHHGDGSATAHHLEELAPSRVKAQYRFSLSTIPPQPVAGTEFEVTIRITDPQGHPVTTLEEHHERLAHFLLVSENLEELHHLHAEDYGLLTEEARREARFTFPVTVRWGGRHVIRADFADKGYGVSTQLVFEVEGPEQPQTKWNMARTRRQGALDLTLNLLPTQLEERSRAEANILLRAGGAPVTDLEKYLGALTHLAIFREGADESAHVHGGGEEFAHMHYVKPVPGYRGPKLYFGHRFNKPGRYRIFAQFQRAGIVYTVPFDVEVAKSSLDLGG